MDNKTTTPNGSSKNNYKEITVDRSAYDDEVKSKFWGYFDEEDRGHLFRFLLTVSPFNNKKMDVPLKGILSIIISAFAKKHYVELPLKEWKKQGEKDAAKLGKSHTNVSGKRKGRKPDSNKDVGDRGEKN